MNVHQIAIPCRSTISPAAVPHLPRLQQLPTARQPVDGETPAANRPPSAPSVQHRSAPSPSSGFSIGPATIAQPIDAHGQSPIQPATSSPSTASNEPAATASRSASVRHLLDPAQIADHEPPSATPITDRKPIPVPSATAARLLRSSDSIHRPASSHHEPTPTATSTAPCIRRSSRRTIQRRPQQELHPSRRPAPSVPTQSHGPQSTTPPSIPAEHQQEISKADNNLGNNGFLKSLWQTK
ncbi:hypothetical protein ACLOJK_017835 [Asimina triloba]